ncbi:hypothetical protein N665_0081s0021 [Sinapis alba]|nr:hypothetical protein N665_0081s0021 [Sinapis alba]
MRPVTLFMLYFILISLVWTCVKDAEAQKQRCIVKSSEMHEGTICDKTGNSDCILKSKHVPKPYKCSCINNFGTVSEILHSSRKQHTCLCERFCKS